MDQKFLMEPEIFLDTDCFRTQSFLGLKIFLDPKFFRPKICQTQNFFRSNFWTQKFVGPTIFGSKIFQPPNSFEHQLFISPTNIFLPKFFSTPKFLDFFLPKVRDLVTCRRPLDVDVGLSLSKLNTLDSNLVLFIYCPS